MRFSRVRLANWRNFTQVDVALQSRAFLVGPNASGKSNFLDVFRFLHDLVVPGGGFEQAVTSRGGFLYLLTMSQQFPPISSILIEAEMTEDWRYRIAFSEDDQNRPVVRQEQVWYKDRLILDRPNEQDRNDPELLRQTYLEQTVVNRDFREIADFFASVKYFHFVPQLVREESGRKREDDPYGSDFIDQLTHMAPEARQERLNQIQQALHAAIPSLLELKVERIQGVFHLRGRFRVDSESTRSAWHNETDFSDGTLRLIGLLWALLDAQGPLLLEEPELSLHLAVVRYIPGLIWSSIRETDRQVLLSTHSGDLLMDEGIAPDEVLVFIPTSNSENSTIKAGIDIEEVRALLEAGLPPGEVFIPYTQPKDMNPFSLGGEQ